MRYFLTILCCLFALTVTEGCGYHVGAPRNRALAGIKTFCVDMFANNTVYPMAPMQMTTALADTLQRDGTFRMASPSDCDIRISGTVTSVTSRSLITNSQDSYISTEIGLDVHVDYQVVDCRTGKLLKSGSVKEEGSYFNNDGNIQSAREDAISYATRKAAYTIVNRITLP